MRSMGSNAMGNGTEGEREDFLDGRPVKTSKLDKAAKKWRLTKRGVIIIGVLLILVLLLLLAFLITILCVYFGPEEPPPPPVCKSPECLRTAARIQESMNDTVNPCSDFWQFCCDGWLKRNPIPASKSRWSVRDKLLQQEREEYRRLIITQPHPMTHVGSLSWKLKHFLESCLDLESIELNGDQQLRRIITRLGGWHVLKSWSMNSWSFNIALREIHAEYMANPFFKVDVIPDPHASLGHIIRISPGGLSLPARSLYFDRDHKDPLVIAFKQYLKDSVQLLGATGPDAQQFAEDLFHYEKRIAEVTPDEQTLRKPDNAINRVSLKSLQTTYYRAIPWLEVLREIFPKSNIGEDTEIILESIQYAIEISNIVSSSDRGTLNNYITWHLLQAYMPYLPEKYRDVHELYIREITDNHEPEERWERCVDASVSLFGLGLGAMYSRTRTEKGPVEQLVENMFHQLKTTLSANVAYSPALQGAQRMRSLEKIETMRLVLGYPGKMLEDKYLSDLYSDLSIQKKDWFQNILNGAYFMRRQQEDLFLKNAENSRWVHALLADRVTYVPSANILVIPEFLFQAPFIHQDAPLAVIWGGLGVEMAQGMVESVGEKGLYYTLDGTLSELDSSLNKSVKHYEHQKDCISDAFSKPPVEESEKVLYKTAYSSLSFLAGIRQAHKSLLGMLGQDTVPLNPTLESKTVEQMFYISLGQTMCSDARAMQKDLDKATSFILNNKSRLKGAVAQMPRFLESFGCSENSYMKPSKMCGRVI